MTIFITPPAPKILLDLLYALPPIIITYFRQRRSSQRKEEHLKSCQLRNERAARPNA